MCYERTTLRAQRGHSGNKSNSSQGRRQGDIPRGNDDTGVRILFQTKKYFRARKGLVDCLVQLIFFKDEKTETQRIT